MGDTACLTSENAPPHLAVRQGQSATQTVRQAFEGIGPPFFWLPASCSLSVAPLIPNPFSETSPFSGGLSGPSCVPGVPCRRRDALHFTPVSSRSAGVAGSFRWGLQLTYCGGVSSNHCFSSLYFFFTNTPVILILGVADVLSLSLVAEVSLPACTPGFPLWISILLCSQPPGTLWHRRTFSPFSPRTRPLLA